MSKIVVLLMKIFSEKIVIEIAMELVKYLAKRSTNSIDDEVVRIFERELLKRNRNKR